MTLGELKLQVLELMEINSTDLYEGNIAEYYEDENYKDYLSRMPSAITRAINRFKAAHVIPTKSYQTERALGNSDLVRLKLKEMIPDYGALKRVCAEDSGKYIDNYPYAFEGADVLILRGVRAGAIFILIYEPKISIFTTTSSDETVVPLPDELCAMIPYFVKADVFEIDEPELSAQSRNIFEAMLAELKEVDENAEICITKDYAAGY